MAIKRRVKKTKLEKQTQKTPKTKAAMEAPNDGERTLQALAQKLEKQQRQQHAAGKTPRPKKKDREFATSYKQILIAAAQEKRWAIAELGAYAESQGNYAAAIEQYQRLAARGELYYTRRIAVIYEQCLEDIHRAIDWYTEAGHYGDEYSMIRAGNLLELHFEDYDEALLWYSKAAQNDNILAIYHLCRIYEHQQGQFDEAISWYERAVQLGDLRSAITLGQLYENQFHDYPRAIEWYSVAAERQSLYAVNLLCQLYETRLQDYPKAIEWYKKAIAIHTKQSNPEAVEQQAPQMLDMTQQIAPETEPARSSLPLPDSEPPVVSSPVSPQYEPPDANEKIFDELSDDLLPRPEDLTPAQIASANPSFKDEAEIEFLG